MKRILCFSLAIILSCVLCVSCAFFPVPSSRTQQPEEESILAGPQEAKQPAEPEETAPASGELIPQAIFDSLCAPLTYISDAEATGHFYHPGQVLTNDFANNYLYHYANKELSENQQQYTEAGFADGAKSVRLTAQELEQHMVSVFGADLFQINNFLPDGAQVAGHGGSYYIAMSPQPGPSAVSYAGDAPLPFDEETEYSFQLTLQYSSNEVYTADLTAKLVLNEESIYGYSIADVVIGSLTEKLPEGMEEATIEGTWIAVSGPDGDLPHENQWVWVVRGEEVVEYLTEEDYQGGSTLAAYPLTQQPDGSARMVFGEISDAQNASAGFYATLTLVSANILRCGTKNGAYLLERYAQGQTAPANGDSPFDSNGFVFPNSSDILLTEEEVLAQTVGYEGYSQSDLLGFARNEIYARHGNLFEKEKYKNHYSQYDWYTALSLHKVTEEELSQTERANVFIILACENAA
ncbi:YARHG domain-containing protein [Christensenellaceae bacterium OttesenSCG-928-K19]|nr:YARHG domain-containing protein [Christensenellaceae bacterium OttesenSCG-928-K19]